MTDPNDTESGHIQFYTGGNDRMSALKYAVNNFIINTDEANEKMPEDSKHRISLVTFADSAYILRNLTDVSGENTSTLLNDVSSLSGNGATNAGAGMGQAVSSLNSARDDSQKVVIFFTDGVPTTSNQFSEEVANAAVNQRSHLEERWHYRVFHRCFEGANPNHVSGGSSDTDQANTFMNAVSSNYPNASAWDTLGQRTDEEDAAYYKTAQDSNQLDSVFQEIFDEIKTPALLPLRLRRASQVLAATLPSPTRWAIT